jgi:hypothetical protein
MSIGIVILSDHKNMICFDKERLLSHIETMSGKMERESGREEMVWKDLWMAFVSMTAVAIPQSRLQIPTNGSL